jgi:chromosome segregation ATPase
MEEKTTKDLHDKRSFEERVFARFDSIDTRLEKLESREYDTKPIWQRALAAIMETSLEVGEIKTKVGAIETKIDSHEPKFDSLETKVTSLETKVTSLETKVDSLDMKVDSLDIKVDSLGTKVDSLDTKVTTIETRLGAVEADVAGLRSDYTSLLENQRNFKVKIARRIDLVLETLVDTHENMRNSDARLSQLESKLA